jgi:hypothetical protein
MIIMKFHIAFLILAAILIAGCTIAPGVTNPEQIARSSAEVKAFMGEYPRATVIATLFSNISISGECGNPQLPIADYWKVVVDDPDTNTTMTAYIDRATQTTVCARKIGGLAPANATQPQNETQQPPSDDNYPSQSYVYQKTSNYISAYLSNGQEFSIASMNEFNGMYNVTLLSQGTQTWAAVTKHGNYMFLKDSVRLMNTTPAYGQAAVVSRVVDYINAMPGISSSVSLVSSHALDDIYNITLLSNGNQVPAYATMDGVYLLLSPVHDLNKSPYEDSTPPAQSIPKSDRPIVQLYVMSLCPYGVQAENYLKPVVDQLGSVADFSVHYIASVVGTTPASVQSMHGAVEAQEDLRQVCIINQYSKSAFWYYVSYLNANCFGIYSDASAYDACWRSAAANAGISPAELEVCSGGATGVSLLKTDVDMTSSKGIAGSPTLVINGVDYTGARSTEDYRKAVCSAFNAMPPQCGQTSSGFGQLQVLPAWSIASADGKMILNIQNRIGGAITVTGADLNGQINYDAVGAPALNSGDTMAVAFTTSQWLPGYDIGEPYNNVVTIHFTYQGSSFDSTGTLSGAYV